MLLPVALLTFGLTKVVDVCLPLPPGRKPGEEAALTEEQLFQQQLLTVQREYVDALHALEREARMTRSERYEVMGCMTDYYNNQRY